MRFYKTDFWHLREVVEVRTEEKQSQKGRIHGTHTLTPHNTTNSPNTCRLDSVKREREREGDKRERGGR